MTSRTTKQAARAYQKTHGVPYAEALRRVMQSEDLNPSDALVGRVGKGKSAAASGHGPFTGLRIDRTEPVYIDLGAGSQPTDGPMVFNLGDGLLGNTGFHSETVPASWTPAQELAEDRPATLGVYAPLGRGKTVYLATLVRDHLVGVPTLLVSQYPKGFPEQEGLTVLDPKLVRSAWETEGMADEEAQEAMRLFLDSLAAALAEGVQVVVYDDGPEEPLNWLLRESRSKALTVLFSSSDIEELRPNMVQPGARLLTPGVTVMLNPARARQVPGQPWGGIHEQSWVRKEGYDPMYLLRPQNPYGS